MISKPLSTEEHELIVLAETRLPIFYFIQSQISRILVTMTYKQIIRSATPSARIVSRLNRNVEDITLIVRYTITGTI